MSNGLTELQNYKNPVVVDYFCYQHPEFTTEEVELLFKDLLGWLWLNKQRSKSGKKTYLFGPLLVLDELWHVFILHTRDYFNFSLQYFGDYFHHEVEPPGFEHMMEEEELRDYLQDCFDYLGQEWVARRFTEAFE